jgi:hypothetical protein
MVHNTVTKGGCTDQSGFGVTDVEVTVGTGQVIAAGQFPLQLQQFDFPCKVKGRRRLAISLAAATPAVGLEKIRPADKFRPEVAEGLRHVNTGKWQAGTFVTYQPRPAASDSASVRKDRHQETNRVILLSPAGRALCHGAHRRTDIAID